MITCFLCKVHGTILSAITGVDWEWKSSVQGFMGVSGAPSGSIMELDLGWNNPPACLDDCPNDFACVQCLVLRFPVQSLFLLDFSDCCHAHCASRGCNSLKDHGTV